MTTVTWSLHVVDVDDLNTAIDLGSLNKGVDAVHQEHF
jgi:hypothetical protein